MRAVGLVPNTERPVARALAATAVSELTARGVHVRVPARDAGPLGVPDLAIDDDTFADDLDLVLAVGGDGTMLHGVSLAYPRPVPVLGVNAGHLGYLTAIEASDFEGCIDRVLAGDFTVSERTVVQCAVEAGDASGTWFGLNEVVLEKTDPGRTARLEVAIAGHPFTTYLADGVIVATPTGTTAYTFSVRGPIVSPTAHVLVLTPVSPHMLFDRSLVLAPNETLELSVSGERAVNLTIDGRAVALLEPASRVTCCVAAEPARIVAPEDLLFHQILKAKFALPDR